MSRYLEKNKEDISNLFTLLPLILIMILIFGLIMLEPDFGTGFILTLTIISMILIAGVKKRYIIIASFLGVLGFAGSVFWRHLSDESKRRQVFALIVERGGSYAISENPSWWTYALKERMEVESLSLASSEDLLATRLKVDWPLLISSDSLPSRDSFSLREFFENFPLPITRHTLTKELR